MKREIFDLKSGYLLDEEFPSKGFRNPATRSSARREKNEVLREHRYVRRVQKQNLRKYMKMEMV